MCTPIIAVALSAAGGIAGAIQQRNIGKANAAMARAEAEQTREIGRYNETKARTRMQQLMARQRGQLAARGVRLDSATALDLGERAGRETSVEGSAQRFNADSRATAQSNEAVLSEYRGKMGFITGIAQTGSRALTQSLDLWPGLAGA
ncbi:hypothetical protein [Oceaniglobus trochenteri]|uniref:hypothetical protein n=1 Tax=Oceaniglobus trochenteri TaxID=2763260 RepID=UPI001CFFAEF6|nr:hypothetical protein [Oceaniglobus trochenteri]